jgi:hypothetical protein
MPVWPPTTETSGRAEAAGIPVRAEAAGIPVRAEAAGISDRAAAAGFQTGPVTAARPASVSLVKKSATAASWASS